MNTKNKGLSLPMQMFGGLVLGVACGVFAPGFAAKLGFLGTMFGHAIKMVVMPLIFLSVTVGVFRAGRLRERLGKVAVSSIAFFILLTGLGASCGLLRNFSFRPGLGASLTHS